MRRLPHLALTCVALVGAISSPAAAQAPRADVLRVLRFHPSALAEPLDSIVVAFDHPVAPQLDRSVDPVTVVRMDPAVRTIAYWRDPSTIVVRFTEPLPYDARYRVTLAPALRSEAGVALAAEQAREIRVRRARVLGLVPSSVRGVADSLQRPLALYEATIPLGALSGRLVVGGDPHCRATPPIALVPDSIRRVQATGPESTVVASSRRDVRLDTMRRVVRFVAARAVPGGCYASAQVTSQEDGPLREMSSFLVLPAFALVNAGCWGDPCERDYLGVAFTRPVLGAQVLKYVRVNGVAPRLQGNSNAPRLAFPGWMFQQEIEPGREVAITIDGAIQDVTGRALGANVRRVLTGRHTRPTVEFTTGRVIVPRDIETLFAMQHVNTDSIVVTIGRVADSLRVRMLTGQWYPYSRQQPRMEPDSIVRIAATSTSVPRDSGAVFLVPASWIPRAWRDEPLLLLRAWPRHPAPGTRPDQWPWSPYAVIERTNLAAHMLSGAGRLDVWVTSLRGAAPVAGAKVRLLADGSREIAAGSTDDLGRTRLKYSRPAAAGWERGALVEISAHSERLLFAFPGTRPLAYEENDGGYAYGTHEGGELPDGRSLRAVAFADRDIYRPGERIHLKGMVRTSRGESGFETPSGDSVRWTLSSIGDDGALDRIGRTPAVLGAFGTTDTGFEVPRTAALGNYMATLSYRADSTWRVAAERIVRVAEYRPVEFEVALDADTSVMLFAGDTARVHARARYLFGVPMDGGTLQWNARIEDREYWSIVPRPPGLDGFNVGRSWWRPHAEASRYRPPAMVDSATLGANGTATIVAPVGDVATASTLIVSASVSDANRRTVTAERRLTVHPADAYVGMRATSWQWMRNVGDSVAFELVVVHADGSRRAGAPIALRAVKHAWGTPDDTVWRSRVVSTDGIVRATFVPTTPGWYEVLATVADERGRSATTGYDLWVTGSGVASRATTDLTVTMDRKSYAPGDTAIAVIDSPGERSAWVTLSTSVPLFERQLRLRRGPNVVRIPVPMGAMPTARLGVIALRPVGRRLDSTAVHFTKSEQWIDVSISSRALDVSVHPERLRYEPGDTVTLRVRVRDATGKGRRAETTVWAVDQGVAALTGLEKPDLLEPLLAGVETASMSSTLTAPVLGLGRVPISNGWGQVRIRGMTSSVAMDQIVVTGYGEQRLAAAGVPIRSIFATTPFWASAVVTDSAGEATTRFVLPHNVTTFRLFSAAITAGTEVGSGDTSVVATRTLLVRAALPRVVRQSDTLLAGGVITRDGAGRTPVRLAIEASGIRIAGTSVRDDTLDGRRALELRFPMHVTATDSATVTMRAEGGGLGDAVRTTLPVSPPGHARAHVVIGTLEGRADVALPHVDDADPDRSTVTLQLGVSPLGIVRQIDRALRIYPYGCTEQITSASRALLARHALERAIDASAELTSFDRAQLERGVAVLVSRQRPEGSIGYWSATDWSTPWLTAYAVSMLLDARDAGIDVPASVLARATAYLSGARPGMVSPWRNGDASPHDVRAALRVLQRRGVANQELEQWLRARAGTLGYVDRLEYAMTRVAMGDSATAREIVRDAWRATKVEGRLVRLDDSTGGTGWLFRSSVRPAARLFSATAALEPRHPMLGALFEALVQSGRSARRWQWNTIEQAELADAIVASRAVFEFGGARTVSVRNSAGTSLATSHFEAGRTDSASFALAALGPVRDAEPSHLILDADSRAPVYYAATLLETPRARPVRADDEGISVERWYESYSNGKPVVSVREGELVRVRLRVTTPADREFVAITDPLPAGLEAVDLSLRTSSTLAPFAGAPHRKERRDDTAPGGRWMYGSWDSGWWTPWDHKEIRDDRVHWFARQLWKGAFEISYVARATTAGVFVRPPAYAEEMYNPAVRGRSDGGWFTVTAAP